MKTQTFLLALLTVAIVACHDDNSHKNEEPPFPAQAVETVFWQKYPNASSVEWKKAGEFQKAEFVWNNKDCEAWYTSAGVWLQTESSAAYSSIPATVKDYVSHLFNYPSSSWLPQDETEVLERSVYPVWYGVELEKGKEEVTIWTDEDAFSHLEVIEEQDRTDTPGTIFSFIALNYKTGWITESWKLSNGAYVVHMLEGNEAKEVYFTPSLDWEYTQWPVLPENLPAAVKNVLKGNAYKDFSVRNANYRQATGQDYYHIILKQTNLPSVTVTVNITPEGEIML